jgi:uncharacterized protein YdaU (DUF1376 family)
MAKDPAFLFYSNDFLAGVQDLTMEERGQYITLLCVLHQKGRINDKTIRLCVGNAAADVLAKFRQDSAGLWYNERLEIEIEKRRAHADKQRLRATEGWKKRKNEENSKTEVSHGNATAMPLEDVNENRNENVITNKSKKEKAEIVLPFNSAEFVNAWDNWKTYRKQSGKPYRSELSEQAALKKLSNYPEPTAIKMIEESIANSWQGIFELKNKNNGNTNSAEITTGRTYAGKL